MALIGALFTNPPIVMVGLAVIASLNVAVIVILLASFTILSESESIRMTVGGVLSIFKIILLLYVAPEVNVPETVAVTAPSSLAGTIHSNVHNVGVSVAVIVAFETKSPIVIKGALADVSFKAAEIVMVSLLLTLLKGAELVTIDGALLVISLVSME